MDGMMSQAVLGFLVNSIWQVALIAGAAAVASRFLRHAPARYQHALWVIALLFAIALPIASTRATGNSGRPRLGSAPRPLSHPRRRALAYLRGVTQITGFHPKRGDVSKPACGRRVRIAPSHSRRSSPPCSSRCTSFSSLTGSRGLASHGCWLARFGQALRPTEYPPRCFARVTVAGRSLASHHPCAS